MLVIPDFVQTTVKMSAQGNKIQNVWYFKVQGGGGIVSRTSAIEFLREQIVEGWEDLIMPLLHSSVTFDGITTVDLDVENGEVWDDASGVQGALGGEPMPTNVAAVVTKGGTRRRGLRQGRFFIGGLADGQLNGNTWLTGAYNSMQPALNDLKVKWTEEGTAADYLFSPQVVHQSDDGVFTSQVTSFDLKPSVSHQDRRIRVR